MERPFLREFFGQSEVPPAKAERPGDIALVQRIEKVAEFAQRNGPDFVQLIENKQHHNPDYRFLFGGERHDYYQWVLYCLLAGEAVSLMSANVSARNVLERVALPEEVGNEFLELLDQLHEGKEALRSCQHCFLKHAAMAEELAKCIYYHAMQLTDGKKLLDVAYLMNDIVLKGQNQRSSRESRHICDSLQNVIGGIFAKIYKQSDQDEGIFRRLSKFFDAWEEYDVFSKRVTDSFEQAMLSGNTDMNSQSASGSRSHYLSHGSHAAERRSRGNEESRHRRRRSSSREDQRTHSSKHSSLPPHISSQAKTSSSHSSRAWGPTGMTEFGTKSLRMDQVAQENRSGFSDRPRTRAAFDPPPEKFAQTGVVDPFSFPPGLIPSLLSEKQKLSFSYCPISSADIQKSIYPTVVDPNDPYLKSRLEKFYAELEEYRPGMVREHIESRKRKEEDESVLPDTAPETQRRRNSRSNYAVTEENKLTAMLPDGSFAGEASESMHAGLGAQSRPKQTEEEKAFNEYRKLRSDVYHNVIPKGLPPPSSASKKGR